MSLTLQFQIKESNPYCITSSINAKASPIEMTGKHYRLTLPEILNNELPTTILKYLWGSKKWKQLQVEELT